VYRVTHFHSSPAFRRRFWPTLSLLLAALTMGGAAASAALSERTRHQIELFADLAPGDSIIGVRKAARDTLEMETAREGGTSRRTSRHFVPASQLDKILSGAGETARTGGEEPRADKESPAADSRPRIREDYMGGQLVASTYVYGVGLVSALQFEGILLPAVVVTGSLAAHAIFSLNYPLDEAQVLGMNYAAGGAIVTSYALPFLALGPTGDAFRIGSAVSLLAYPLSLAPGYRYGSRFRDRPGALSKKVYAAGVSAATGAVLPWVYLGPDHGDLRWRLAAGQILAFGAAGHFAADLYRPGETLTEGVTTGIGTHTVLGTVAGFALASSAEGSRTKTGMVLAGALAGFGEGLWFFRDRNDPADQANYSGFGMAGGMLLASAAALTSGADASTTLWLLAGSGAAGYAIVYRAMDSGREGRRRRSAMRASDHGLIKSVSLALAPVPELTRRAPGERFDPSASSGGARLSDRAETRYKVPGLIVKF
jgi:hypothetical protein